MEELDEFDFELYNYIKEYMPITLSELARNVKHSKSMIYKRIKKLEYYGLINIKNQGGVSIILINDQKNPVISIGILRASEYPYILNFVKGLRDIFDHVNIVVYDNAFKEAVDLSTGKIQLAMNPAISLLAINRLSKGMVHIIGGGSGGGSGIAMNPSGKEGHSTSMMSSMELCAEINKLETPRIYSNSGDEILNKVVSGHVRYGVLWEPYLSIASRNNIKTISCELDTCCLLGANASLSEKYEKITKIFSKTISTFKMTNLDGYANLIGMPLDLVKQSVKNYTFFEEPDKNYLKKNLSNIRNVVLPYNVIEQSVII
ncbi:putative transcriptional regulator [Caldisphaera lagunensis DSM 15908]|uniref:Putative transcriptional regulator n=1 Tax=Caldisphaera lagunensis (strain DSM 15908 / JCM 11604 / ANMR 0165 / IC-154) TaxID=1056495 RepID=L0AAU8_CALLD|nr:winged helix-turn-helix transcriptional regulator [Caldisphaera lagunensis]AFZ70544.1 putative transcriptional regulator [Caldisphaera lagunensis DSM 15908]